MTEIFEIKINQSRYGDEWRIIWKTNNFSGWDDATSWLYRRYNAKANRFENGFLLIFPNNDQKAQFVLEWF